MKLGRVALPLLLLAACGNDDNLSENPDGSFGTGAGNYARDAGMDGAARDMDAALPAGGPVVSVRFLHAIPNTGALLVCHDPDGAGPMAARALNEGAQVLRAEFGSRSAALRLPALAFGVLTLQRAPLLTDAGVSDPVADGGVDEPCGESTREATIPLPITGQSLSPREPLTPAAISALGLLTSFADAPAITLFGTGVALDQAALAQLAQAAGATESLERLALEAAFGPRALIQPDLRPDRSDTFSLAALHAVPDVPPAAGAKPNTGVGALRLCVTAGMLDQGVLPHPPAPGIPFRVRSELGRDFDPRLSYEFRAYAQADFDARRQDCATTSLNPVARASYDDFVAGHAYTLALVGAIAPSALCSADRASLVRAGCSPPPVSLGARIEILED